MRREQRPIAGRSTRGIRSGQTQTELPKTVHEHSSSAAEVVVKRGGRTGAEGEDGEDEALDVAPGVGLGERDLGRGRLLAWRATKATEGRRREGVSSRSFARVL